MLATAKLFREEILENQELLTENQGATDQSYRRIEEAEVSNNKEKEEAEEAANQADTRCPQ